jgi:hypothetical protein
MDPMARLLQAIEQLLADLECYPDWDSLVAAHRLRDRLKVTIAMGEALSNSRVRALNVRDGLYIS